MRWLRHHTGDVIVADDDGAVVIPLALVGAVLEAGAEQERLEAWIMTEIERGVPLLGLYPPDAEARRVMRQQKLPGEKAPNNSGTNALCRKSFMEMRWKPHPALRHPAHLDQPGCQTWPHTTRHPLCN